MAMDLYDAILARRSVRRYAKRALDDETRIKVDEAVAAARPLVDENDWTVLYHDVAPGEDLVQALGAYGRLVTPPHYMVPYLRGDAHPLTDLGYRAQQIVVRLTQAGLGSCYLGAMHRQDALRALYRLPEGARVGAVLVYGYPSSGRGDRLIDGTVRRAVGATRKRAAERLFYDGRFDRPSAPPSEGALPLAALIEAARSAASADNAQPWRFLWREGRLYLYLLRKSWRYGMGGSQDYRWFDGGICMANVALAMEARGIEGRWALIGEPETAPPCPEALEPLAVLRLG